MAGKAIDPLRIDNASQSRRKQKPHVSLALASDTAIVPALGEEPAGALPTIPPPLVVPELTLPPRSTQQILGQHLIRGVRSLAMPLIWISLLGFCGGTGVAAFLWLATLPPTPNCKQLNFLSGDADRLVCADQAAKTGDETALIQAIDWVSHWSPNHPLQERAKPLLEDWSKALLNLAYRKVNQNDLPGAIALVQHIPATTPSHEFAQKGQRDWGQDLQKLRAIEPAFVAELKAQKWDGATDKIQQLSELQTNYWKQQRNRMRQRIVNERMAWQQISQSRELAHLGTADALTTAIAQTEATRSDSLAYQSAVADVRQWGQQLIQLAEKRLEQGDLSGAIALTQTLPRQTLLPPALYQLVWLEQAQRSMAQSNQITGLLQRLWTQANAVGVLQTVMPNQALHPATKDLLPRLRRQTEDLAQLNAATAIARIMHPVSLQLAIQTAAAIAPDRPQRLMAQTLIADWRQATLRSQNALILKTAQQAVEQGGVANLQAAIAQAEQISLGQPLRPEAQAAIFDWQTQLQAQRKR